MDSSEQLQTATTAGTGRFRRRGAAVLAVAVLGLGAVACSSDSETSDESSTGAETSGTEQSAATTVADGPCPTETSLTIVDSEVAAGPLDVVSEFADVTLGESADLVFASYEIEEDPQFGMSAPVGDPQAPTGGTIVQFNLQGTDEGLPLVAYSSEVDASPRIAFTAAFHGAERINPMADHVIELTEVTEERLCGTIAPAGTGSSLQTLPYVEGSFVVPVV